MVLNQKRGVKERPWTVIYTSNYFMDRLYLRRINYEKMQIIVPEKISYSKAIRAKCLDCCCGQVKEVALCEVKE